MGAPKPSARPNSNVRTQESWLWMPRGFPSLAAPYGPKQVAISPWRHSHAPARYALDAAVELYPGSRRIASGGGWLPPVTMLVWTVLVDVPALGSIRVLRQGRIPRPTRCRYKAWTLVRPPPLGAGPGPRNGPRLSPSGKGWRRGFGPVRHPSLSPCFVYIRRGVDNLPAASVWASTLPRPKSTGLKGRAGRRRKLVPCWPPVAVVGTP